MVSTQLILSLEWQSAVASVRVVFDVHFMLEFSNVVRGLGF